MNNKLFVLTIPGIGTQKTGYSEGLEKDLIKFSKRTPLASNFRIIETRPFSVAEIDDHQEDLFRRLDVANNLGGLFSLRKFVLEAFGDGVTFERNSQEPDSSYKRIHQYIKTRIEEANQLMAQCDNAKLVIVAASMGVHLLSTYIWDADNNRGIFETEPATNNNNLKNLSYLATIGCNIPLFVSGLPESKITPFAKRNAEFTWDNYYDKDDVLGWPLQQLSDPYNQLVKDHEINTGLYVGSHVKYWDDNDFTKPLSKKLLDLHRSL